VFPELNDFRNVGIRRIDTTIDVNSNGRQLSNKTADMKKTKAKEHFDCQCPFDPESRVHVTAHRANFAWMMVTTHGIPSEQSPISHFAEDFSASAIDERHRDALRGD